MIIVKWTLVDVCGCLCPSVDISVRIIHPSDHTVYLPNPLGKKNWFMPRESVVMAKGKGELHTFWLMNFGSDGSASHGSMNDHGNHTRDESKWVWLYCRLLNHETQKLDPVALYCCNIFSI